MLFINILKKLKRHRSGLNTEFNNIKNIDAFIFIYYLVIDYTRSFSQRINPTKINLIGKNVELRNKRYLSMGKKVKIGNYCLIDSLGLKGISLGNNVTIGDFSRLIVTSDISNLGSHIIIHDNVGIGEFSRIGGSGGVTIHSDTIIGQYLSCHPENHNFSNPNILIRHQGTTRSEIIIGKNCWIGAKVTVTAGVTIGDNCVIAAGSVVTSSFEENSLIGGVPAKLIRKIR
ncbi:acyltransferase [Nitrincola nitratireducens]|uniref:Galactoside O-acetyltransferase n=1 Tax=Nitrincola nitratireducens TaxID=1229521 RepID=W9UZ13_9GAMM|nr:acyltransferase [Nitrincola nitratireducens]EXJ09152.1 Galactoside O-acetyltransferase [Nitrincola nitratireducens]